MLSILITALTATAFAGGAFAASHSAAPAKKEEAKPAAAAPATTEEAKPAAAAPAKKEEPKKKEKKGGC